MRTLIALGVVILTSHDAAPQPRFEVASIRTAAGRTNIGEGSQRSRIEYTPTTLTMENVDLTDCLRWA